jgi:hypothetical protein
MMFVSYNLVFVSCKAKLESFREPFWLLRTFRLRYENELIVARLKKRCDLPRSLRIQAESFIRQSNLGNNVPVSRKEFTAVIRSPESLTTIRVPWLVPTIAYRFGPPKPALDAAEFTNPRGCLLGMP